MNENIRNKLITPFNNIKQSTDGKYYCKSGFSRRLNIKLDKAFMVPKDSKWWDHDFYYRGMKNDFVENRIITDNKTIIVPVLICNNDFKDIDYIDNLIGGNINFFVDSQDIAAEYAKFFVSLINPIFDIFKELKIDKLVKKYVNKSYKTVIKPVILNYYNKLSHNIVSYADGGPIKDIFDCICDIMFTTKYESKFKKKKSDYLDDQHLSHYIEEYLVKKCKFTFDIRDVLSDNYEYKLTGTNRLCTNMTLREFYKSIYKTTDEKYLDKLINDAICGKEFDLFVNFVVKKMLYNLTSIIIRDRIVTTKEYCYIKRDCDAFFSGMLTTTTENRNTFEKAFNKINNIDDDKCMKYYLKNLDNVGRDFVSLFEKRTFKHINEKDQPTYADLRRYYSDKISSKFIQYFKDLDYTQALFDSYHHDLYCWDINCIEQKVKTEMNYENLKRSFKDNINKLIDSTIACATFTAHKIGNKNTVRMSYYNDTNLVFQSINAFFSVLRTIFKTSGTIKTFDKMSIDQKFNEKTFKEGLRADFFSTKVMIRFLKRYNLNSDDIVTNFVNNTCRLIKYLTTFKVKYDDDTISVLLQYQYAAYNSMTREFGDICTRYLNTTADHILNNYAVHNYILQMISPFVKGVSRFVPKFNKYQL